MVPISLKSERILTVDVIIECGSETGDDGIVMIERKNPPHGWALPGGFVDYGESLEAAAVREAREETSLNVELIRQFHAYSDPGRDERQHNVTVVFIARPLGGVLKARDDASAKLPCPPKSHLITRTF
ncbi:MAG: NUDIX hydrolase [Nitrospinae bacterium]|nr:NUDIX hydrolase [Nitrospinota bacterium]